MSKENRAAACNEFWEGFLKSLNSGLFHPGLIEYIIRYCFQAGMIERLHDISTTARAAVGIQKAISSARELGQQAGIAALAKDLEVQLRLTRENLRGLADAIEQNADRLQSAECRRLIDSDELFTGLIVDLAALKMYFNMLLAADRIGDTNQHQIPE